MSDEHDSSLVADMRLAAAASYVTCACRDPLLEGADRIEELEAALREISKGKHVDPFGNILDQPSREANVARRALGDNDE